MLNWLRKGLKAKPAPSSRAPEVIELVSRHVQDQVVAFTGRPADPMPAYSRMTDLLLGAYVWGLIEGCLRHLPAGEASIKDAHAGTAVMAEEVCARVLGPKRMRWVRGQLPQWEGPTALSLGTLEDASRRPPRRPVPGSPGSALLCQGEQPLGHASGCRGGIGLSVAAVSPGSV